MIKGIPVRENRNGRSPCAGNTCHPFSLVTTTMTQTADIEVSRGNAKLASGVFLFLGIPLFLNYVGEALGPPRLPDVAQPCR